MLLAANTKIEGMEYLTQSIRMSKYILNAECHKAESELHRQGKVDVSLLRQQSLPVCRLESYTSRRIPVAAAQAEIQVKCKYNYHG